MRNFDQDFLGSSLFYKSFYVLWNDSPMTLDNSGSDWVTEGDTTSPADIIALGAPYYYRLIYPVVRLDMSRMKLPVTFVNRMIALEITFGAGGGIAGLPVDTDDMPPVFISDPDVESPDALVPNAGGTLILWFFPLAGKWAFMILRKNILNR